MLSSFIHSRSERLRGLATTGAKRSTALPNLPTVDGAGGKVFDVTQRCGLFASAGTPDEFIRKVNGAMVAALKEERARIAADGVEAVGNSPAVFAKLLRSEIGKWVKVVRAAGLKPR
jgi:tripartite-type tricarboxylate transporter receptor subunit TctC